MSELNKSKLDNVRTKLLGLAKSEKVYWPWLSDTDGKPIDKKRANKFIFGCIINYQKKAAIVWENAKIFTEKSLGDPEELWKEIVKRYPTLESWNAKKNELKIHHLSQAHKRIWTIGKLILEHYDGDIRKTWINKKPVEILECFKNKLKLGEQISRMVVLALIASKQISGTGDVKADTHVKKVLGRIFYNHYNKECLSEKEATELTRKIYPENPWILDGPLYIIGQDYCKAKETYCDYCDIVSLCDYFMLGEDETTPVFWNNTGLALYEQEKYEEAIECYEKAIKLDPDYIYALNGKADCLMVLEEYEKAAECYEKAITLYILFQAGIRRLPYKNASCISDYTNVLKRKGDCLLNLKKYEEAIKCYEKALKLDSTRKDIIEAVKKCKLVIDQVKFNA